MMIRGIWGRREAQLLIPVDIAHPLVRHINQGGLKRGVHTPAENAAVTRPRLPVAMAAASTSPEVL